MGKKVTLEKIAGEAGVSLATVSYVLSGKKKVSREVTERIKKIAAGYGYKSVSEKKKQMEDRQRFIGFLVLPNAVDPRDDLFSFTVQQGIFSHTIKHEFLPVYNRLHEINMDRTLLNFVEAVEGLIILNPREDEAYADLIDLLTGIKKPFVIIGMPDKEDQTFFIDMDIEGAAYQAANLLFRKGCRRVIYFDSPLGMKEGKQLRRGFQAASEDWGIEWNESDLVCAKEVSVGEGKSISVNMLKLHDDIDAFITPNEILGRGVLVALEELRIAVPAQCKVISLGGGIKYSEFSSFGLSTIDYAPYKIGEEAAKMLIETIFKIRIRPSHLILPAVINEKLTT